MQHITGSAAHIGMDYHTVTLRLTPTDNKLQRDVHWGRRGRRRVAAEERTWGKEREEEETSYTHTRTHEHTHTHTYRLLYAPSVLCEFFWQYSSMNVHVC